MGACVVPQMDDEDQDFALFQSLWHEWFHNASATVDVGAMRIIDS